MRTGRRWLAAGAALAALAVGGTLVRDREPLARLQVPQGVNAAGFGPPSLSLRLGEPPTRP